MEKSSTNLAAELRDLVNRVFDPNDLHALAFDFNIDYDAIPGEGKSRKVVELLQILSRQQRIPDFIERCKQLRPGINWQPLLDAAKENELTFHIDYDDGNTAVSQTTSPSLLQNKNALIGAGAVLLLAIVAAIIFLNMGRSTANFDGDEGLQLKIDSLVVGTRNHNQLLFDEGLPGWRVNSSQLIYDDGDVLLGPQSSLLRDKTFTAGEAILIDFALSEVSSSEPAVTFYLQNAENTAEATRIIALYATSEPESIAIEDGEQMAASQFARNTRLEVDTDYTAVLGLDANGRFLAAIFGFSVGTENDARFVHIGSEEWANDTWWFRIESGDLGMVSIIGGWEFAFDEVQ